MERQDGQGAPVRRPRAVLLIIALGCIRPCRQEDRDAHYNHAGFRGDDGIVGACALGLPAYEQSVKNILGDSIRSLTFAEHHSHASSVGHSNMVVIARQLVVDASEEDINHTYLNDSVASGCRVQGWFMDTSAVSQEMMDRYLDCYNRLAVGWPLAHDHHIHVLAQRMATLRPAHVVEIL